MCAAGAKQMSVWRMNFALRGRTEMQLLHPRDPLGRAGICFKEESSHPWLLSDAHIHRENTEI